MNKFILKIYYPLIHNREFSNSGLKLSDIDGILSKATKQKEELENYLKKLDEEKEKVKQPEQVTEPKDKVKEPEPEAQAPSPGERTFFGSLIWGNESKQEEVDTKKTNFLTEAKENVDRLMDKQEEVEGKIISRIEENYEKLSEDKGDKIFEKYLDIKEKIKENIDNKALGLEDKYEGKMKSVDYYEKKVDIEAAGFKKLTQIFEKEEKEIFDELKKEGYYKNKEEYEKERSEWKEKHQESVRECRQEKQDIKAKLVSNLEKPSEMAEDLQNETGPDYTGGDD